jgi:hypothetical protein
MIFQSGRHEATRWRPVALRLPRPAYPVMKVVLGM